MSVGSNFYSSDSSAFWSVMRFRKDMQILAPPIFRSFFSDSSPSAQNVLPHASPEKAIMLGSMANSHPDCSPFCMEKVSRDQMKPSTSSGQPISHYITFYYPAVEAHHLGADDAWQAGRQLADASAVTRISPYLRSWDLAGFN